MNRKFPKLGKISILAVLITSIVLPAYATMNTDSGSTPTNTSVPTPTEEAPSATEKEIMVTEILIQGSGENLSPELELKVKEAISSKVGSTTSRSKLEKDLTAIHTTGAFSHTEIIPTGTAEGVKLTIVVKPYPSPILGDVQFYF